MCSERTATIEENNHVHCGKITDMLARVYKSLEREGEYPTPVRLAIPV